ncbi:MAG: glycosyltransferase, partial [Clostridia bacterium]|nr:glycosyltransferase [Clostridia bacterium]
RMVDALAKMPDVSIEWTHCGGGALLEEIKEKASALPPNIRCIFTDTIPNTAVYELYRDNDYHVFVNVSQSEGVPVSIMEAMSFGLPVIATDVGGTAETIDVGNSGYLLGEEYADEELVEYLYRLIRMSQEDYDAMRRRAREKFEQDYNAIPNYHKFLQSLREHTNKN